MASQRPVQQSPGFLQEAPARWQTQRPLVQFIVPQHSALVRHAPPLVVQHCVRASVTT
jgi:hypothetical protein